MMASPLLRLSRLSWAQRLLLGEAFVTLAGASLAIHLLSFRRVAAAASRRPRARVIAPGQVKELRWAVEACARRVPWKAVCFQRGLALQLMLRRRGLLSLLHYGVRQAPEGLAAHVWISLDGATLIGGEEAPKFVQLATFPADGG